MPEISSQSITDDETIHRLGEQVTQSRNALLDRTVTALWAVCSEDMHFVQT